MSRSISSHSQSGMIAIMVTLILMLVISLLVLGFAQVSRHEQHNTLDNQLSTQAYYAAESGINDAVSAIRQKLALNTPVVAKKVCKNTLDYNFTASSKLNTDGSVSYSCLLIDPAPLTLNYAVGSDQVIIPLISGSGARFKTITIQWTPVAEPDGSFPADPLNGCLGSAGELPPAAGVSAWNCKYPLLRAEIVPTTFLHRNSLISNDRVDFLEPVKGGPGAVTLAQNGNVVGAKCNVGACHVTVSGFSDTRYYLRLGGIYGSTHVTVTATDASGPDGLEGAQAVIDATGRAQGILRRVVVAVDLNDANSVRLPSAALVTGDTICKRFSVADGFFNVGSDIPGGNGNPLCIADDISPPTPPPPPPPPPHSRISACGITNAVYVYNLENYNFPDWKVKYFDLGRVATHPISDTSHPVSIPAGTYRYGAGASDNHPNPGATNRSLHYNFYNGSTLIGSTRDTPNMPPSKTLVEVTGTITLSQPATSVKVEHAPMQPSSDDSIDSGCLALGP